MGQTVSGLSTALHLLSTAKTCNKEERRVRRYNMSHWVVVQHYNMSHWGVVQYYNMSHLGVVQD